MGLYVYGRFGRLPIFSQKWPNRILRFSLYFWNHTLKQSLAGYDIGAHLASVCVCVLTWLDSQKTTL